MAQYRKNYWFHGIQVRMIFMLIFTTTLIFTGFMAAYYHTTRTDMNSELNELAEFFTNHLVTSLTKPLWDTDAKTIEGIMNATMKEKQVYAVFVKDDLNTIYGKIRNDKWEVLTYTNEVFPDECITGQRDIVRYEQKLGELKVCLTPEFMLKALRDEIIKMLLSLAILDSLLFLMLLFSIRKIIILPIRATSLYLKNISTGDIPEKIEGKYKGEFNEIRNSMNMLIEATNQTINTAEEIASGNLTVEVRERSENDRMMQAFNQMIKKLNEIKNETDNMIQAVGMGLLDIRGDAEAFEGGWRELVIGINDLVAGFSRAVSNEASISAEMELAKKIQTVLLPRKPRIEGYEIAASCEPADEVGGDYYDVISVAGYDWIVVGDVSGHGVTSGLVMMMVQTAIHTVLMNNPAAPPSHILSAINMVIYENIKKMDEAKHMTIVVLAGGKNGKFSFSGLHEDIMVRRTATGKVEYIETDGFWIGMEPDISDMLTIESLTLNPGDYMVLFTDGVTEAKCEYGMFGNERLAGIIENSNGKNAAEIHSDILNALHDCEKSDDVTIFVMKRF